VTTVRMPIRVRVEVVEDRVDDELVAMVTDAVDVALGRAVDRALTVRMISEAPARWDAGRPPVCTTVSVSGDPLPGRVLHALEESLRTSVDLAAARLTRRTEVPDADQIAARASEVRDDDRVIVGAAGDAYQVPYYDRHGEQVSMRLQGLPPSGAKAGGAPTQRPIRRLRRFQNLEEAWAEVVRRSGGAPPDSIAVVGAPPSGVGAFVAFFVRDGRRVRTDILPLAVWNFEGGSRQAKLNNNVGIVDADEWSLYGQAGSEAAARELLIQAELIELRLEGGGGDEAELKRQAERRIDRLPAEARSKSTLHLYQLTANGSPTWIGDADPRFPHGPLDVLVLSEYADEREDTYGKCPPLSSEEPATWLGALGLLHDSPSAPSTPFLGEPAIELWPPRIASRLTRKVAEVASLLHIPPGTYVGGFLIGAMAQIDRSCRHLIRNRAPMGPQLRAMAAAFGPVKDLQREYVTFMLSQDDRRALPCPVAGQSAQWVTAFTNVLSSARDDAVASMFVTQCQDVLLQVLFASGHELTRRATNFDSYMALTRLLLRVMLADVPELMTLREAVQDELRRRRAWASATMGAGGPLVVEWIAMSGQVADSLDSPPSRDVDAGTVSTFKGGPRVYDGKGRWWSLGELDAVIATQRQQVTAVDPVLDKVSEVDDIVRKLKAAQVLDAYASTAAGRELTTEVDDIFRELLTDLIKENRHWQEKTAADRRYAFGLANFSRDDAADSELGANLSGIHKLAHERLRPAFTDPEAYRAGISRLAAEEIGKAELSEILNLVGLTVLAIFCAPLAFAVGVVQAAEGLQTAFEHRDLQRVMLDADDILSKAQVEAEMWAAVINAALTVLPEVPSVVRGARTAGRALVRGEATEVAVAATRQAMRDIAKRLAELSVEHFTLRFTKELTQGYLINLALSKAMNRIADAVAHQVEVTGDASLGDLGDIGDVLERAIEGGPQ
jgi:hypothetical protein